MPPVSESLPKLVAAPERSLVQRMDALQRANDVRSRRAQLKRDLKAGRQPIHALLLEPPEYLGTAKVFDLLLRYAVSEEGALHAEKYYQTVSEEFAFLRPAFRWRELSALARVTTSEYGYPARGYAEACKLLRVG